MKLIEFLISKGCDGWKWPNGIRNASCNACSRDVIFHFEYCPPSLTETLIAPRNFDSSEIVTREQYEAALAASKPEWNGEGLPPVGAEVECVCNELPNELKEKLLGHILYSGEYTILKTYKTNNQHHAPVESVFKTKSWAITPICSEADKKRENLAKALHIAAGAAPIEVVGIGPLYLELADKIIAGEVAGIRID